MSREIFTDGSLFNIGFGKHLAIGGELGLHVLEALLKGHVVGQESLDFLSFPLT